MRSESGLYIILVAVMLFMLMGLIVLVIGLGAIGTNKTRLQNAANSAALSALEAYINADPLLVSYGQRADAALLRTNKMLGVNKMPGTAADLGNLELAPTLGDGGTLELGMWYAKNPDPGNPPCPDFPCFVPNHDYGLSPPPDINAARVFVRNQSNNPLIINLAGIIGRSNFFLSSNSTAALAPRCIAYVMDISGSSKYETHPHGAQVTLNPCNFPGDPPSCSLNNCDPQCNPNDCPQCIDWQRDPAKYFPDSLFPANVGLVAFRANTVQGIDCSDPGIYGSSSEISNWCNYERDPRGGFVPPFPFRHNRNDYGTAESSPHGPVFFDKLWIQNVYEGPQPLVRNFLGFNAGLRFVEATQSPGDLSVVMAFTDDIRDRFPDPQQGQGELTPDLGFLIQLTNVENRGITDAFHVPISGKPEIHPNFIDRGWFPAPWVSGGSHTNIVKALYVAASALHSECLPTSRKAIILASDGVSTCSVTNDSNPLPVCEKNWGRYLIAENQLLNTDIYTTIPFITQLLSDWEIALTALVDSAGVRPNFYNIRTNAQGCNYTSDPNDQPTDPKCFMTYEQARASGFGGLGDPHSFFHYSWEGAPSEQDAYLQFGQPGVVFSRPMGVLGKMAIMTGGFMCGLLERGPANAYVDFYGDRGPHLCDDPNCDTNQYKCSPCVLDGTSGLRKFSCDPPTIPCDFTHAQTIAPQFLSKSEQAARCAQMTAGLNPFTLVARDTDL